MNKKVLISFIFFALALLLISPTVRAEVQDKNVLLQEMQSRAEALQIGLDVKVIDGINEKLGATTRMAKRRWILVLL